MSQNYHLRQLEEILKSYISTQTIYPLMIYRNSHFYPVTWIYRKCRSLSSSSPESYGLTFIRKTSLPKVVPLTYILISNKEKKFRLGGTQSR